MSGNLPFDRLIGDRLPSSGCKYFSFWRKTLETVLIGVSHGGLASLTAQRLEYEPALYTE